jgi:hypothetical protein
MLNGIDLLPNGPNLKQIRRTDGLQMMTVAPLYELPVGCLSLTPALWGGAVWEERNGGHELHAHQHPDRIRRTEQHLKPRQVNPAHPQPGEQLDGQGGEAERVQGFLG